jgi:hypothetical protein
MRKIFLPLALFIFMAMPFAAKANAQDRGSRESKWDMSKDMLWGYFFTPISRAPLALLDTPYKIYK